MTSTATRLITLILLLQRQPNQKAAALSEKLGVSVRSLHRYISMLDEMGIPVYSERGPYGGFSLARGYKLPPLVFTPEEAVAVCLGTSLVEELWGQLYREAGYGALAKLENVLPDEQRHEVAWARRSLLATGLNRSNLSALFPTLEKLRRAAREHRCVHMTYQTPSQTMAQAPHLTDRDVNPYALVLRWGWWFMVGYCHLRQGIRTFRVDRIQELDLSDQTFAPPVGFDLRAYLASEPFSQPQITARLRFQPELKQLALENRVYWDTVEEQEDGSVVAAFSSPTLEWAASTTLAYGPAVTVLDPPELRQMVLEWVRAIVVNSEKEHTPQRKGNLES